MWLSKLFTKNLTRVPLLWIELNYEKYKKEGKENSCIAKIHPILRDDLYIENTLRGLVDYIRDSYDMEDLV